jgi:hypothetical protein
MDRSAFVRAIARLNLTRAGQAIALLWFYRQTQLFEDRTARELADDLRDEGLGRPNVTELHRTLSRDKKTVKGKRQVSFQLNIRYLEELTAAYGQILELKEVKVTSSVLPQDLVNGSRLYIERMFVQINGSYDLGFYDACAVLIRRLLESLIIEIFIKKSIPDEIKAGGVFLGLENLIIKVTGRADIPLGRNSKRTMNAIKLLGDTAAHDRTYITQKADIDDHKQDIRRLIQELLGLAGIVQ